MVGLDLQKPPKSAKQAAPTSGPGINGVVWNDFKLGGGGTVGQIDQGEVGVPGIKVHAESERQDGRIGDHERHRRILVPEADLGQLHARDTVEQLRHRRTPVCPGSGKDLITWSIIIAYLWAWAGFAMVLLASGMAAISREALEAARMDGATEWQVFRKVTVPLLAPTLTVVFVTMVINVLKVFDLVFIISAGAGANQKYGNVLATQLYDQYGNQQYGAASAIGIFLVILVLPAMIINIRRFRREGR